MVDRMVELPSRGIVVEQLIRGCLDPPPDRRRRDLPVILLLGIHGSGKTVLLREVERRAPASGHASAKIWRRAPSDRTRSPLIWPTGSATVSNSSAGCGSHASCSAWS